MERKIKKIVCYGFIYLAGIIIPLFYEDRYFNIIKAKSDAYRVGASVLLLLFFFLLLMKNKLKISKISKFEFLILLFVLNAFLSSAMSYSFVDCFWGSRGWRIGLFALASGAVFICVLSKTQLIKEGIWFPICVVNCIIFSIGILHSMNLDVFHLHQGIKGIQYYSYISTIGNANWMSGYLCLLIPILLVFFCEEKDKIAQFIYFTTLALGLFNGILCNSDGLYLGIGISAFFLIPFVLSERKHLCKVSILVVLFSVFLLVVKQYSRFKYKAMSMSGITMFLMSGYKPYILIIAAVSALIFLRKPNKKIILISEFILSLIAVLFLDHMLDAADIYNYSWGNNRSFIWYQSMYIYKNYFNLRQKIFGVGPDMLKGWYYYLSQWLKTTVLTAHSVPVQTLLTLGINGILIYSFLWIRVFRCYFEKKIKDAENFAYFASLAAYFGQSWVNSTNPNNFALFVAIAGLFLQGLNNNHKDELNLLKLKERGNRK